MVQDLRNAWDIRDRDEFERLLALLPASGQVLVRSGPASPGCSNMHCGGPRSNGDCGMSTPGVPYEGHCLKKPVEQQPHDHRINGPGIY